MAGTLFIVHRLPYPPDRGDKIRSYHLLRKLATLGPVHLASFIDTDEDAPHVDTLKQWTTTQCIVPRKTAKAKPASIAVARGWPLSVAMFHDPRLQDYVDQTIANGVDAIMVFSGQMAVYVPRRYDGVWVMDFVDVDSAKFAGYAKDEKKLSPMRLVYRREGKALAKWEEAIARRATRSLFVSEAEADLFRQRTGLGRDHVMAVGNGIDFAAFDPARADWPALDAAVHNDQAPLIVFTGQMDYRPNIEAVTIFAEQALPHIRAAHPGARFAIVGRAPTAAVKALSAIAGVIVTGAVPDTRSWLARADVVVAPLRLARGIQNKVLEAMAMGRPVVLSPAAAEGIDATDGVHLRVGHDVAGEIAAVNDLLHDRAAAQAMGDAARRHVVTHYSWDHMLHGLPRLLAQEIKA